MNWPDDFVFPSASSSPSAAYSPACTPPLPARAIADDMDGVAEPITELGKQHHAWVRERGLPSALDHHAHP